MRMNSMTDIELVLLVAKHNETAFTELVRRHRENLQRLAYSLLPDKAAADDAVQETFIRLWTHVRRYDPHYNLDTWLRTICCRRCYSEMRRHRRLTTIMPDIPATQADTMEVSELAELLRHAIATLPPKQRIVYQLREIENLSAEETAAVVHQSLDQVKANLWVARNTIKEKLKSYGIQ